MASLVLSGDTSGTVTLAAPTVAGTQSYTLPTAVPAANGYALTSTTGGTMSWSAITATAGSTTQVIYNSGGTLTGSANMTFDGTSLTVNTVKIGLGAGAVASNTSVGNGALNANTTGALNSSFGYQALIGNLDGYSNNAFGWRALNSNTSGFQNAAFGDGALFNQTSASNNVGVGYQANYYNVTGTDNVAIGYRALFGTTTNSKSYCVAIGSGALQQNATGANNTAVGYQALTANTASNNTAVGYQALTANTTGNYNTAVGMSSGGAITTGAFNTALGWGAMQTATGSRCVAVGLQALQVATGGSNICIGPSVGGAITTGAGNVVIGGDNQAGSFVPVFGITTENNRVALGSTATTNAYIQVAWTVVSDARDKTDFQAIPHGLSFVQQLNPVSFYFKESRDIDVKTGIKRYGFKAQEILALEGDDAVIIDNENPDKLRYNGEALVPVLVKAIQELSAANEALTARIAALEAK